MWCRTTLLPAIADNSNEQSPRAYLNYIVLDKDFNYLLNSGFDRLSTSAEDPGDGSGTHQKLSFEEIAIDQDGYLMVFLSNESQQTVEVFWDDFRVDHHHNAVIQASDYFPFGLAFNEYKNEYSIENRYLYNSFEKQVEWGVYDYQARFYDPALGRFLNIDPAADLMRRHSPYNYAFDNPIRFIDPDGRTIIGSDGKAVTYTRDDDGNVTWSDNATDDTKKLGNALLLTDEGTAALDNFISIETEITLKIDAGEGDGGGYAQTDAALYENGDPILNGGGILQSATITVFEGALNKDKSEGTGRFSDASTDEFLNATGVHENEHLSPDQIQKDYNYTPSGYKDYITNQEGVPLTSEYNARKSFREKYGGNSDWKAAYIRNGINPENLPKPKKKKKGN